MPVGQQEHRIYLGIAYGKLRLKAEKETPGAVWREYENKGSWAIEYSWIEGKVTRIFYKESADYGNSYEVNIWDGQNRYNVSFKENSRYCFDFLTKLPHIDLSKSIKITPYEMDDKDGKTRRGTSIQQNGIKLKNYFSSKVDDKWIYREGFPEPTKKDLSAKEWQLYSIQIQIFLQDYIQKNIIDKFEESTFAKEIDEYQTEKTPPPSDDAFYSATMRNSSNPDDDLPF
jgi:hypothetical protein